MTEQERFLLLVEDDPNDVELLLRGLRKVGFPAHVRVARDGVEAVEILSGAGPLPSLVVLDLKLPRKSGFEVLAWLRAQPELGEMPVAILSSSSEEFDVARARGLGATWYLVKASTYGAVQETARKICSFWTSR